MSNVATIDRPTGPSITAAMADRYGMVPAAFEATLRATVVPKECTREQFAAFLLVAHEYGLNPILKEIYAFPAKGGGIQPVVGIDGWVKLMNSHPQMDGIEYDDHLDDRKALVAVTARIYRKDRSRPVVVTEYMSECRRNTDPWKQWPHRMLRHKATIQAVRYAFGYSNIPDADEAESMGADVSGMRVVSPPPAPPPAPKARAIAAPAEDPFDAETGEVISEATGHDLIDSQCVDADASDAGGKATHGSEPIHAVPPAREPSPPTAITGEQRAKLQRFAAALAEANTPAAIERGAKAFWTDHSLGDDDPSPLAVAAVAIVEAQTKRCRGELSIADADAVTRRVIPL